MADRQLFQYNLLSGRTTNDLSQLLWSVMEHIFVAGRAAIVIYDH